MSISCQRQLLGYLSLLLLSGLLSFRATAQNPLLNAYRLNLQTPGGKFLTATRGVSTNVMAIVDNANLDELFVVTDENGGQLQSGDPVRLYAHTGYVTVDDGDDLMKASGQPSQSSVFTIIKAGGGAGPIRSHDQIMLQTEDGGYLSLQNDGHIKAVTQGGEDARFVALTGINNPNIQNAFSDGWNFGYNISFDDSPQGHVGRQLQHASTIANLLTPGGRPRAAAAPVTQGADAGGVMAQPANAPAGNNNAGQRPTQPNAGGNATPPATAGLPANLPVGHYKCLVDHIPNVWNAGYFSILPGNRYVFEGFDANKRDGVTGSFSYDHTTGKILWLSGSWKTNKYYGIYALDKIMGDRIYLIPDGSDYSACKCFLQKN